MLSTAQGTFCPVAICLRQLLPLEGNNCASFFSLSCLHKTPQVWLATFQTMVLNPLGVPVFHQTVRPNSKIMHILPGAVMIYPSINIIAAIQRFGRIIPRFSQVKAKAETLGKKKFLASLWTHQFPHKFASREVFAITFLLFTTCMTTCTFLERYFDREAYSVIKIRKRNKMLTKITLEVHDSLLAARTSLCNFDQAASFERGFCNIFKCTRVLFFVAMPSPNPSLPIDSVQACLHDRECVDFGQQANMWFYTYSSMLCPQIGICKNFQSRGISAADSGLKKCQVPDFGNA